jgi:hypothetical protein
MDREVHVAQLAGPVRLAVAVPLIVEGKAEHVSVESHHPVGLAGDEDDPGDEMNIFRSVRAVRYQAASCE